MSPAARALQLVDYGTNSSVAHVSALLRGDIVCGTQVSWDSLCDAVGCGPFCEHLSRVGVFPVGSHMLAALRPIRTQFHGRVLYTAHAHVPSLWRSADSCVW
jgi:hypothetical protein